MAFKTRGQAALEFLTTYGWAFLIILIMIGTLAYFGILSPSKLLPGRCNFGSEFQCADYLIQQSGAAPSPQFKVKLKNGIGESVDPDSVTISKEDGTAIAGCVAAAGNTAAGWGAAVVRELAWTGCTAATTGWVAGDKGKVLITLNYHTTSGGVGYTRTVKGEVYSTVQ